MAEKISSNVQQPTEVEISSDRVRLVGVYEDIRPLVKTTIDATNSILRAVENIVGLPCDFVNYHLQRFRDRYQSGVEEIPKELRELPPLRLSCTVVREAVYSAEEPELQEMFAKLLVTASDSRVRDNAHPGFANTITQLTPFDAKVITELASRRQLHFSSVAELWPDDRKKFPISCANLIRLGIAELQYPNTSSFFSSNAASGFDNSVFGGGSFSLVMNKRHNESDEMTAMRVGAKKMAEVIEKELEAARRPIGIVITDFGSMFALACLGMITATE